MEESKYINKKWDLETMKKRLENLKKIIPENSVELQISLAKLETDDELDALYIAYYRLKDVHSKIKRKTFGKPKDVKYEQKCRWTDAWDYTWDVTTRDWTYSYNAIPFTTAIDYTNYYYPATLGSTITTVNDSIITTALATNYADTITTTTWTHA